MARKIIRLAAFRPVRESFRGIRWNRLWHEAHKRIDPRFFVACKLDWTRMLKRPDRRFDDGRQVGLIARRIGGRRIVFFAAYIKRAAFLNIVSIRYADDDEEQTYFRHYP